MNKTLKIGLLLIAISLTAASIAVKTTSLTILHTNDTHGHLMPFSYPTIVSQGSQEALVNPKTDIGGIARRATLVKQLRQSIKNLWLVDCGDFCDGTPFSTEYKGSADIAAMNAVGYNFGTFGNHEFNNTLEQLKNLIATAKYPVFLANVVEKANNKLIAPAYAVEKVGDVKIGIFGLVTTSAGTYPASREGLQIKNEVQTAKSVVAELKNKADIIILISHCGVDVDEAIAKNVDGVDVIIGGHSHSRLPSGMFVWRNEELMPMSVNGTIIVQAFQWGGELGRLDLLFAKDGNKWRIARYRARLQVIDNNITPNVEVAEIVDSYWKPISKKYDEVIGTAEQDFSSRGDDNAEYNLVADAVRESYNADFGLENMGGVRSPLVKGKITIGDVVTMDPFNNTVIAFRCKGSELKTILEKHKPAVSGIKYRIENGKLVEALINGSAVEDEKNYIGVTNSYFAGYALKNIKHQDTGKLRLDTVVNYIKKKGSIAPRYDGRRVLLNTNDSY